MKLGLDWMEEGDLRRDKAEAELDLLLWDEEAETSGEEEDGHEREGGQEEGTAAEGVDQEDCGDGEDEVELVSACGA